MPHGFSPVATSNQGSIMSVYILLGVESYEGANSGRETSSAKLGEYEIRSLESPAGRAA